MALEDFVQEKPTGLKLVLKVGTPLTPSDITADSQSETFDSDTATSETKLRLRRRVMQNDRGEPEEKKVRIYIKYVIVITVKLYFIDRPHSHERLIQPSNPCISHVEPLSISLPLQSLH